MGGSVIIVRHTQVALHWRGRCYGSSDPGLSREGRRAADRLARKLAEKPIDLVIHSGLRRAEYLAERIAAMANVPVQRDPRWKERDFGEWEGRTWNSIWRRTGSEMDGMLMRPRVYRPGGGETTSELIRRAIAAWRSLPAGRRVIVVAHGGPIAAVRAHLSGKTLEEVMKNRLPEGGMVRLIKASGS